MGKKDELVGLEKIFDKYTDLGDIKGIILGIISDCSFIEKEIIAFLTMKDTVSLREKNDVINRLMKLKDKVHVKVNEIIMKYEYGDYLKARILTNELIELIKSEFEEVRRKIE